MACLRCGKELESDVAFCLECQESMKQYPVKPGTPVMLPPEQHSKKNQRKAISTEAEAHKHLVSKLHTAVIGWVLTFLLLCGFLIYHYLILGRPVEVLGQNYSAAVTETAAP